MGKVIKKKRGLELVTSPSSCDETSSESVERNGKNKEKYEYPENKKSFLDEIKNIFHSF